MEPQALHATFRRLRDAIAVAPPATSDAELLRAFSHLGDPRAFEQIVRRHGPMVFGVCRRLLGNSADADDAFQATFLILVRKAGALRTPERLAGWLHQVAHRTARKAGAIRRKRAQREGELFDVPAGESPAEVVWRELRPIFDAELDRLPDRLRLPAVLCLVEGQSKSEAARALGWPEGTLSGRLQRARERLRVRLAARGLTLSAAAFSAALFEASGTAAVPARLIEVTLQGVLHPAASAGVRALADGVTQAMFLTKLKAAAAVLVAGVVGGGAGMVLVPGSGPGMVAAGQPEKPGPGKPGAGPDKPETKAADPGQAIREKELELLRERLAWEERMVKKGYMSESQAEKTRAQIAQARAGLAEAATKQNAAAASKKALEQTINQMEQIVAQTRVGVQKGIVPESELLNMVAKLAIFKDQLAELDGRPAAPAKLTPARRAALEELIKKLEDIAAQAESGFKKGIVPQQEVLNAQARVLEYKFKLLELDDSAADGRPAVDKKLADRIAAKEAELVRAGALLKQNAISTEEVRRLRIDLARLKAEAATPTGNYDEAVTQREKVVAELDAMLTEMRKRYAHKDYSESDLNAVEAAIADARFEMFKARARQQLAKIVSIREDELRQVRRLFDLKAVAVDEVQRAERGLAEARARLAAER